MIAFLYFVVAGHVHPSATFKRTVVCVDGVPHISSSPTTTTTSALSAMAGIRSRPTRTQARRVASTLSILFIALIAILCLCPVGVRADDNKEEYGTVIGIGQYIAPIR
jgi:hypothetical protein